MDLALSLNTNASQPLQEGVRRLAKALL